MGVRLTGSYSNRSGATFGGGETTAQAFDNSTGTKLCNTNWSAGFWFTVDTGGLYTLDSTYTIYSANDASERDPRNWVIEGSNDNSNWTTLDTVTGQGSWGSRQSPLNFTLDVTGGAYRYFRMTVNAIQSGSIFQISELQLFGTLVRAVSTSDSVSVSESTAISASVLAANLSVSDAISVSENKVVATDTLQVKVAPTRRVSGMGTDQFGTFQFGTSNNSKVLESILVHDQVNLTVSAPAVSPSDAVSISENKSVSVSDPQIPLWGPNLIENPGFEDDSDGTTEPSKWDTFNNPSNIQRRVTTEYAHSGTKSYKINTTDGNNADCGILQNEFSGRAGVIAVAPNTQYRFSSFIKTALNDGQVHTHIKLFEPGYAGETGEDTPNVTGTNNWVANDLIFTTGANQTIAEIWVCFGAYGNPANGEAWFDDFSLQRNEGDVVTVTESSKVLLESLVNKSESISVTEQKNLVLVSNVQPQEAISLTENTKLEVTSFISVQDSLSVSEAVKMLSVALLSVADAVTVSESSKVTGVLLVGEQESITVSDSPNVKPELVVNISDSVGVSENNNITLESYAVAQESIGVAELATVKTSDPQVVTSDSIALAESVVPHAMFDVRVQDLAQVSESTGVESVTSVLASENIGVTDAPIILGEGGISLNIQELIAITESIRMLLVPIIQVGENIDVGEDIKIVLESDVRAEENIGVSENISIENTRELAVQEAIAVAELTDLIVPVNLQTSDGITVTDTPMGYVPTDIAVADQISVGDNDSIAPVGVDMVSSDTVSVVDSPTILRIEPDLHLSVSDNISVTDDPIQFDIRYVDEVARKLIMVEGRLAYLITGRYGSLPQYIFV